MLNTKKNEERERKMKEMSHNQVSEKGREEKKK